MCDSRKDGFRLGGEWDSGLDREESDGEIGEIAVGLGEDMVGGRCCWRKVAVWKTGSGVTTARMPSACSRCSTRA